MKILLMVAFLFMSVPAFAQSMLKVGDRDEHGDIVVSVGEPKVSVLVKPKAEVKSEAKVEAKPNPAVCPKCGKVHAAKTQSTVSVAQQHAQREANYMARTGVTGHPMGVAPGASFSGTGYGPSPNCRTCTPSRRMTLIADAVAQGRNGYWYRSRHWR